MSQSKVDRMINKSRSADLAAQLRKQAVAARKELLLPVPGIAGAPDFKFQCVLRRIDILSLVKGGRLPDHLAAQVMGVKPKSKDDSLTEAEGLVKEMTLDDLTEIQRFQREVAVKTCLEPALYFPADESGPAIGNPDDPNAVNLEEIDFADALVNALFAYATSLSPDVPVATADGGATTLKAVSNFPEGVRRDEPSDAGDSSPESGPISGKADGASG